MELIRRLFLFLAFCHINKKEGIMKKLFKKGVVAAACVAGMLAGYSTAHAESYSFTNLGDISRALYGTSYTLQQPENKAFGINDSGQVVGILKGKFNGTSQTQIIRWDNVGTSGTTATSIYTATGKNNAYDINNSGQIVGFRQTSSYYYAFEYNPVTSTWTNLGKPTGSAQSVATAMNDAGQVVGYAGDQAGPYANNTAFIYSSGTIKHIPGATVGASGVGSSMAMAINNQGLVTGYSTITGNIARAFIYNSATDAFSTIDNTISGLSASTNYYGMGINASGSVVGFTSDTSISAAQMAIPYNNVTNPHAFLYTNADGMIDLGALGGTGYSQANAINNAGTIVGTSNGHAFIYENNHMLDLNELVGASLESGFTLTTATGINNLGQIIGYGTNAAGEERAFALTVTPTPIPPTVLLFASGLSGMFFLRRRKPSKES
jgi:probable HAF family extracellular repeat protein